MRVLSIMSGAQLVGIRFGDVEICANIPEGVSTGFRDDGEYQFMLIKYGEHRDVDYMSREQIDKLRNLLAELCTV
jgi:hypothetical protein